MAILKFVCICAVLFGSRIECSDSILRRESIVYGMATIQNPQSPTLCEQQLRTLAHAVENREVWAMQMMDSSGRPTQGFLRGNNYWLGDRVQCTTASDSHRLPFSDKHPVLRNITDTEYTPYPVNFFGAYATHNFTLQTRVFLPKEGLVKIGLCLPLSCNPSDVRHLLQLYFNEHILDIQDIYELNITVHNVKNMIDNHIWLLSTKFILMTLLILIVLSLTIIGTAYDSIVYQPYLKSKNALQKSPVNSNATHGYYTENITNSELERNIINLNEITYRTTVWKEILLCFSMYSNIKTVMNTKIGADSIACIHGLRFGGMMWIILVHTIFYSSDYTDNKVEAWRLSEGVAAQIFSNSTLSVDTFFFLSGFLVAYLYYKDAFKDEKQSSSIGKNFMQLLMMTIRRYLRLTPTYMVAILIITVNYEYNSRTSLFELSEPNNELCSKYWWRNLLYINNLFPRSEMCLSWSWYLSNDMQFFVIGSILAILSTTLFTTAYTIIAILMCMSIGVTAYISYTHNYIPTLDEQYALLEYLYDPPWTRIGPYLVGIITGYIVVRLKGQLQISKTLLYIFWTIGPILNLVILFGLYDRFIPVIWSAIYQGLSRTLWAVGIAWVLIACTTNHGGIINKILSYRGFIPFSRMTYCAYLLNPYLVHSIFSGGDISRHIDFMSASLNTLGFLLLTFICAFVFTVLIETPSILLMKLIVNHTGNSKTRRKSVPNALAPPTKY